MRISWGAVAELMNTRVAFAVMVILARLLTPQDFGVVAMAIGVQSVLASLVDFGFVQLIIRAQNMGDRQLSGLFFARLGIGIVQGLAMYALAQPLSGLLQHQELRPVIEWLSAISALGALTMVPEAQLRKKLDFKRLAIASVSATGISGALGIGMALNGYGRWSLVAQYLASVAVNALLLHILCDWRPVVRPDFSVLHQHKSFITNSYGLNIVGALVLQGDKLVLGHLLGASNLGLYMHACGLAQLVPGFAITIAEQVGFSSLSQSNDDIEQTRHRFLRIAGVIGYVTAPVMFMIAVLAEPIVLTLYGAQWGPSIPILRLVALALFVNAINLPWDFMLRALGRVDVLFKWSLLDGSTRLGGLTVGAILGGANGAALGFLLAALAWFFIRPFVLGEVVGIGSQEFLRRIFPSVMMGSYTALGAWLSMFVSGGLPGYLRIAAGGLAGSAFYFLWCRPWRK